MHPHLTPPSLCNLTLRALRRHPDRVAFQSPASRLTYRQALDLIGRFQAVLHQAGLRAGTRVALLTANRADTWCAGVAAQGLGLTTTWMHSMGSLAAHLFQIEDADVAAVVVDAQNYGARAAEIAAAQPQLRMFTLGPADAGTDLLALAERHGAADAVDWSNAADLSSLAYTGGTTGRQKGVAKTGGAAGLVPLQLLTDYEIPAEPRFLAVAPISHVTGTGVVPTLMRGGTVHLLERFDVEQIAHTVAQERINFTMMVPTMVYGLLDYPRLGGFDLSSLELLLYAGSPMSRSRLAEGIERLGPVFNQLYGQAECSPIAAMRKADHDLRRPELLGACGYPVSGCDVRIVNDKNEPVRAGEPGEICVRGPSVIREYWRQPALTEEALAGGWLHTGDIAVQDDTGRLYIVDRKKDMIVTGGFNVYPKEVEDALASHPAVGVSAVIGAPDPKWGETVRAYVVLRAGASVTEAELIAHIKALKGSVNTPKHIDFADALPQTALGKIDKKALRDLHWGGQTRNVS